MRGLYLFSALSGPVLASAPARAEPLEDPISAVTEDVYQGPTSFFEDPARLSRELVPMHAAGAPLDWELPGISAFASTTGDFTLSGGVAVNGFGYGTDLEAREKTDALITSGTDEETWRWTNIDFGVAGSMVLGNGVAAGVGLHGRQGFGSGTLTGDPRSPELGPNGSSTFTLFDDDGTKVSTTTYESTGSVRARERMTLLSGGVAVMDGDRRPWGGLQLGVGRSVETIDYTVTTRTQVDADNTSTQTEAVTGLSRSNLFGMENTQVFLGEVRGGIDLGGTAIDPKWRATGALRVGSIRPAEDSWTLDVTGPDIEPETTTYEITEGSGRILSVEAAGFGCLGDADSGRVRYGIGVSYARDGLTIQSELNTRGEDTWTDTETSTDATQSRPKSLTGYDEYASSIVSERELSYWGSVLTVSVPVAVELPVAERAVVRAAAVGSYAQLTDGFSYAETDDEPNSLSQVERTGFFFLSTGLGISWVTPGGAALHLAWQPEFWTTGSDLTTVAAWIAWHPGD